MSLEKDEIETECRRYSQEDTISFDWKGIIRTQLTISYAVEQTGRWADYGVTG